MYIISRYNTLHDETFCNERRQMEGAVSRYSFVPRYSFSDLIGRKRERRKKSAEMVSILKYTCTNHRWDRLTRFDTLTTGNVAAFISRVSSCLLFVVFSPTSTKALLIHYENFSKTNE